MSASKANAQKKATEDFIEAWKRLSLDEIVALRTSDCLQYSLPSAALGTKGETNEQFLGRMRPAFGVMSNFKVDVDSVSHDTEGRRSIVHARTDGDLPFAPYKNEHIFIFHFTDDGTKMARIDDMMDSTFVLDLSKKMEDFQKKQSAA